MKFSIVVGYRDRGIRRVERFVESIIKQSYSDFELIFVDYGSADQYQESIRKVIEAIPRAKYIYTHTRGWMWNRSHALNTGIRSATGDFVITTDVDLIFHPSVLEKVSKRAAKDVQIFQEVIWLPKDFNGWSQLFTQSWPFAGSGKNGFGGLHCFPLVNAAEIGGFDEYYHYWGVEDRDFYERLVKTGLKELWMNSESSPLFHQWHPKDSATVDILFPKGWWEEMILHDVLNRKKLVRNEKLGWGRIVKAAERRIDVSIRYQHTDFKKIIYPTEGSYFKNWGFVEQVADALESNTEGDMIKIEIDLRKYYVRERKAEARKWLADIINFILYRTRTPYRLSKECKHLSTSTDIFYPVTDAWSLVWKFIQKTELVADYCFLKNGEKIEVILCR